MLHTNQHPDHSGSRTASLLNRIMAECEGFGARYQYSPRLMFAGAVLTAIRRSRSAMIL
ncbi:hypothetical protein BDD14_2783 [Edaphobacter modestus]|uniref:Uncharacterized protein n=1 Tax=Edaphobacter modestus TaxID=388466 RepID=A0A4Q7YW31_9BACT|nr:hypothetical protein BDD14_2783 [Edaphobacter modestus]